MNKYNLISKMINISYLYTILLQILKNYLILGIHYEDSSRLTSLLTNCILTYVKYKYKIEIREITQK